MHSYAYVSFSALSCVFVRIDLPGKLIAAQQRAEFNVSREKESQ